MPRGKAPRPPSRAAGSPPAAPPRPGIPRNVAPPDRVRGWIDHAASADKRWVVAGLDGGFAHDYGHLDLGLGVDAAREIHPLITGWLARARDEGRWAVTPGD